MKIKMLLSAAVVLMALGEAKAADDFTSPLYLPSEAETLSDTSVAYKRVHFDRLGSQEDLIARETMLVGFGQETAVLAGIGNRFNFKGITGQDYNNEHNFDYELGLRKNFRLFDNMIMQLGTSYYTYNPRSWYGHSGEAKAAIRDMQGNTRWYKELRGEAKLGFELEDGLLPYASLGINGNIDNADRDLYYTAVAGVHKFEYNFAFDAGLRYEFKSGHDEISAWFMQGSADYFLNDNMTLGAYVDYQFADSSDTEVDYGYTTEARFKILF